MSGKRKSKRTMRPSIISRQKTWQNLIAIILIGGIAGLGAVTVFRSFASSNTADVEPETGTKSSQISTVTSTAASGGSAIKFGSVTTGTTCTVNSILVNSCRPWIGSFVNAYSETPSGDRNQIEAQEARTGKKLDIAHTYHPAGSNTLSADDKYFANRANTILATNWKPPGNWAQAGDVNNAAANSAIDTMAASVKSLGTTKIIFIIYHEPENNVTSDSNCPNTAYASTDLQGTPTDYRAMWKHVHDRFATDGVTNVVWGMNYMGFSKWSCIFKDLWPGNNLVDWVFYDPYSGANSTSWDDSVSYFYNFMLANNDSTHDFMSKPWGLGEFGIGHGSSGFADQAHTYQWYDDAKASIDTSKYPRLKALMNFDSRGTHDSQVTYTTQFGTQGYTYDATELQHYSAFVNDSHFTDAYYK